MRKCFEKDFYSFVEEKGYSVFNNSFIMKKMNLPCEIEMAISYYNESLDWDDDVISTEEKIPTEYRQSIPSYERKGLEQEFYSQCIIIASTNESKVKELREILKDSFKFIYSLSDLEIDWEVEEDMEFIEDNAIKKVDEYYKKEICFISPYISVISDDTGLYLKDNLSLLGVKSKRLTGNIDLNNEKVLEILSKMKNPTRKAYYKTSLAMCSFSGIFLGSGKLYGEIGKEIQKEGFAFDRIFTVGGRYLSDYTIEEKNKISSRAVAFEKLNKKRLESLIK